jgi:CheY-like chemotaxis protein
MPNMDGIDLACRIRDAGYEMPILMLTSNPPALRDIAGRDCLTSVLQKPVLRRDLVRQLQNLSSPPQAPEAKKLTPALPRTLKRPMRILAAEDNKTNRLVFSKMVEGLEINLEFALNGREAVEKFTQFQPDMIFMDISMPEMDGLEATGHIRALPNGKTTPIVALTAHAMDGDEADFKAAGMDHYLTKPLRKALIIAMIVRYAPEDVRAPSLTLDDTG